MYTPPILHQGNSEGPKLRRSTADFSNLMTSTLIKYSWRYGRQNLQYSSKLEKPVLIETSVLGLRGASGDENFIKNFSWGENLNPLPSSVF